MIASITFALNKMRNQNGISELKLFRKNELIKHETSSIAILRVDGRIFRDCR
ncbi:hypothetical protein T03_10317 [Trichinella britovi]|uniref:Uncharacterized protein n=1 Tax=Trichinella britovi TaxID=45882 RepID=A0A0V0Z994_TRIBR|nr:hypothetical protein T03_10317 [Trichinella britovi]